MEGRLKGKYAIVGVGETEYSRASGRSTRALGVEAIRNAIYDAGLTPQDVDGMLSYHGGDSTPSTTMMYDLGMRLNFYMDCSGGGSSTEALIGLAIGAIEGGMCDNRRHIPRDETDTRRCVSAAPGRAQPRPSAARTC